jgi:uncharacterized protein
MQLVELSFDAIVIILRRMAPLDPILNKFRDAVAEAFGARIVLFGSRARGDASPDSDYDIAVFLEGLASRFDEIQRLTDIELSLREDAAPSIHAMPYPAGSWRDPSSPLMYEIRKDGLDL